MNGRLPLALAVVVTDAVVGDTEPLGLLPDPLVPEAPLGDDPELDELPGS